MLCSCVSLTPNITSARRPWTMPEPMRFNPPTTVGSGRATENPRAGYEEQDIRFRPIVFTVVALGIVLGVAAFSAYRDGLWQKRRYRSPQPTLKNTALPAA